MNVAFKMMNFVLNMRKHLTGVVADDTDLQNPSFVVQNSSFLMQNSSFLMQNSSFLLTSTPTRAPWGFKVISSSSRCRTSCGLNRKNAKLCPQSVS